MADSILPLVRRWVIDWLCAHDAATCDELMVEDYSLRIGVFEFSDRASYVKATSGQLDLFPGLMLTVHEILTNGTDAAIRFTEHGASTKDDGRAAAWRGVVLFSGDGERLTRTWAEEDYHSRKRQLRDGLSDEIAAPAVAPWDTAVESHNPQAEGVVEDWVASGMPSLPEVSFDDDVRGDYVSVLTGTIGSIHHIVSAGNRVAVHGEIRGLAVDGSNREVSLNVAAFVHVMDGKIVSGQVVTDRLGALASLRK